jgi:capsular exopolysaccharide synthesis family protein
LQHTLNTLEGQATVQGQARAGLRDLEANAESSRSLYDRFVARTKETQEQEGLQTPDARVISRATPPTSASFPKSLSIIMAALPMSLLLGFAFAFSLERLDSGFKTTWSVEESLGIPVLGTLPEVVAGSRLPGSRPHSVRVVEEVVKHPLSGYSEAVRGLSLAIELGERDTPPHIVLITSAIPGEGKSTTALSLARSMSRGGRRVAVIDGDFRRPTVARIAGIRGQKYDLVNHLTGDCTLDKCLLKDPSSDVVIVPVRELTGSAPDLAFSEAMSSTVNTLRRVFDMVIIDSAPLLPVNDTKALAGLADTVLLVIQWEKTNRYAAIEAAKALLKLKAPVAGCVFTRADARRYSFYNYGYNTRYSDYARYYRR